MHQVQMIGGIEGGSTLPESCFIVYIIWASNALPPGLLPAHVIGLPAHKQGFPTVLHAAFACNTSCCVVLYKVHQLVINAVYQHDGNLTAVPVAEGASHSSKLGLVRLHLFRNALLQ